MLATALQSGLEGLGETEVVEVVGSTTSVLSVRYFSLVLDGPPSEEVVAMEEPVGPNAEAGHPDRSYSPQPPRVGLCDEVRVVKHLITNQLNYTHLYSLPNRNTPYFDSRCPISFKSVLIHISLLICPSHNKHILALIGAMGQVIISAQVKHFLWVQDHRTVVFLLVAVEGEDVATRLLLEFVHTVNQYESATDASQLTLVLR